MTTTSTSAVPPQGIVVAVNKVWTKDEIREKLRTNRDWAIRGMLKIYEYQTAQEKSSEHTIEDNGIGFTGVDGTILSSFSQFYLKYNRLSDKQMAYVFKKMPKYSGQLLRIIHGKQ